MAQMNVSLPQGMVDQLTTEAKSRGISRSDVVRERLQVPLDDPVPALLALQLYKTLGEIGPSLLQRRLRVSYQQAVDIIKMLVAAELVDPARVLEFVDMRAEDEREREVRE